MMFQYVSMFIYLLTQVSNCLVGLSLRMSSAGANFTCFFGSFLLPGVGERLHCCQMGSKSEADILFFYINVLFSVLFVVFLICSWLIFV